MTDGMVMQLMIRRDVAMEVWRYNGRQRDGRDEAFVGGGSGRKSNSILLVVRDSTPDCHLARVVQVRSHTNESMSPSSWGSRWGVGTRGVRRFLPSRSLPFHGTTSAYLSPCTRVYVRGLSPSWTSRIFFPTTRVWIPSCGVSRRWMKTACPSTTYLRSTYHFYTIVWLLIGLRHGYHFYILVYAFEW